MVLIPLLVLLASMALGDDLDDLQTEFILPYSETEDVDFTLVRHGAGGCYQWSTNNSEVIRLDPVITDYKRMCGSKLELQILPGKCKGEKTTIEIVAESVDVDMDSDVSPVTEYLLHVHPVHNLEVLGLKTELTAGSDPVPFGVAGYDDEDNEFDTLDGLQISWFVGGKREVAVFERHRQIGPIVKLLPLRAGHGAIMALLTDANYAELEPAVLEFDVSAPLTVNPDGAYLLEGANAKFTLTERGVNLSGEEQVTELDTTSEESEYKLEVKEPKVVSLDPNTNAATGQQEGETTILVKNRDGDVVRTTPVRVTTAHHLSVLRKDKHESKQFVLGNEYEIEVVVYDKDENPIYPSENILCKMTFPKQFYVIQVSENGLWAKIRAITVGVGKLKASLRSVLTDDDEELEIVPHVKGSTDFEVYESVVIKPRETILPWDEDVHPTYDLIYQASGGGKVYEFTTDNEELATANNEGKVTTHGGPGVITVRAAMVRGSANYDEAKVYILPATHMEFKENSAREMTTSSPLILGLKMLTFVPGSDDPVLYTDCSDVPIKVTLSDYKNFEVETNKIRGGARIPETCTTVQIIAKTPGTTCKVTVTYTEPSTGRVLKASTHVSAFRVLTVHHPDNLQKVEYSKRFSLLLPVGGTSPAIFRGGPTPWQSKPSAHFKQIEVDDPDIIRVHKIDDSEIEAPAVAGNYSDVHAYRVTCIDVGQSAFTLQIGNTASTTNPNPAISVREVFVNCDIPTKLVVKAQPRRAVEDLNTKYGTNRSNNRIMVHNYRDLLLSLVVKNAEGQTFHDISSLKFEFKVSDEAALKQTSPDVTIALEPLGDEFGKLRVPGRPYQSFSPNPAKHLELVDLTAILVGYQDQVLTDRKAQTPPAIPRVDLDDDEDDEDDEEYESHHHSLSDSVELQLAVDAEINAARRAGNK